MNPEIESTVEDDFKDLVEYAQSPSGFHRGAKLLLGDDYKELGEQIIEGTELKKKFESYFEGENAQ